MLDFEARVFCLAWEWPGDKAIFFAPFEKTGFEATTVKSVHSGCHGNKDFVTTNRCLLYPAWINTTAHDGHAECGGRANHRMAHNLINVGFLNSSSLLGKPKNEAV